MGDGPYLMDVSPIALAHSEAPVREAALAWIQKAARG